MLIRFQRMLWQEEGQPACHTVSARREHPSGTLRQVPDPFASPPRSAVGMNDTDCPVCTGLGHLAFAFVDTSTATGHRGTLRDDGNRASGPKQGRNRERAGAIWTRPVHIWLGGGEGDNRFQIFGQCEPPDILHAGTRHRNDFRGGFAEATKLPTPGLPGGEQFGVPAFVGMTIGSATDLCSCLAQREDFSTSLPVTYL